MELLKKIKQEKKIFLEEIEKIQIKESKFGLMKLKKKYLEIMRANH